MQVLHTIQGPSELASVPRPQSDVIAWIFLITKAFLLLLKYDRPIPALRLLHTYPLCQRRYLNVLTYPIGKAFWAFAMVFPS